MISSLLLGGMLGEGEAKADEACVGMSSVILTFRVLVRGFGRMRGSFGGAASMNLIETRWEGYSGMMMRRYLFRMSVSYFLPRAAC